MEIRISRPAEDMAVVHVRGKYTIEKIHQFKDATSPLICESMKTILICFSEMEYIDSSGIGSLILLMNSAKNMNIDLILYDIHGEIMNVFKTAYLDKFFHTATMKEITERFPGIEL